MAGNKNLGLGTKWYINSSHKSDYETTVAESDFIEDLAVRHGHGFIELIPEWCLNHYLLMTDDMRSIIRAVRQKYITHREEVSKPKKKKVKTYYAYDYSRNDYKLDSFWWSGIGGVSHSAMKSACDAICSKKVRKLIDYDRKKGIATIISGNEENPLILQNIDKINYWNKVCELHYEKAMSDLMGHRERVFSETLEKLNNLWDSLYASSAE